MKWKMLPQMLLLVAVTVLAGSVFSQKFEIVSNQLFGGSDIDELTLIRSNADISAILTAGYSYSSDYGLTVNHGLSDEWMQIIDNGLNISWSGSTGGTGYDWINDIEVIQGGFVAVCGTGGISGVVNCITGGSDAHIIQINDSGEIENQQCISGSQDDVATAIVKIPDEFGSGYYVGGTTRSIDNLFAGQPSFGNTDIWLARLSNNLAVEELHTFGSSGFDILKSIVMYQDDVILAAETDGNDGTFAGTNAYGSDDVVTIRLNASFGVEDVKRYGGSQADHISAMNRLYDFNAPASEGLLLVGSSWSPGFAGCTSNSLNAFAMKTGFNGDVEWITCMEGSDADIAWSATQSQFNPWIFVCGETLSNDLDFNGNYGVIDAFLASLDVNSGNLLYTQTFGGSMTDKCYDVIEVANGKLLSANSTSSEDYDVTGPLYGLTDGWVVEFDVVLGLHPASYPVGRLEVFPNPASQEATLVLPPAFVQGNFRILDLSGRPVYNQSADNLTRKNRLTFQTGSIPDGFYILQLMSGHEEFRCPLIIIH